MKRRLYIIALITSPFIALYGTGPLYIFGIVDFYNFLYLVVGLTINVFLFWFVHIYFELKFPGQNKIIRFIITYLINILLRAILFAALPEPQLENKYIAYPFLTFLALNAIIMILVQSIVTGHKRTETEKQFQELKWQNLEAQKQVLMQQLQPHFLFNALSTLKSLIQQNTTQAESYVIMLSDFLRYSLQSQNNQLVTVEAELKFVNDFINLQKVRFCDAFCFSVDLPESIMQKKIPVLALQILVENIFKHNTFTEKKCLHFSISTKHDRIIVWNEKTYAKLTEKNNTGLNNLNARYLLICNKSIEIVDTENEFCVTIPVLDQ